MDLMFLPGYRKLPDYRVFDAYTTGLHILIVIVIKTDRRRNMSSTPFYFVSKEKLRKSNLANGLCSV